MSISLTFPFTTASDYTYDPSLIEITAGKAQLKLVSRTGQLYTQPFTADTDFTYDNTKAEFSGGKVQQKDQRGTATFFATYTTGINASWSTGIGTGTAYGGATVVGGKLDLSHNDIRYIKYASLGNVNNFTTGTVRFKITPNYSGAPATYMPFFCIANSDISNANQISLWQYPGDGHLSFEITNYLSSIIVNANLGAWNPVSGTEYEFEVSWDIATGANRLFINGIQKGTTNTQTGILTAFQYIKIGNGYDNTYVSNFSIDNLVVFSTVQHTTNYTPGTFPAETIYVASKIFCPAYTAPTAGEVLSIENLTVIDANTPHYTIGVQGVGQFWWDGAAWAISNETHLQSNTPATIAANLLSLTAGLEGTVVIIVGVYFNDSSSQMYVDNILMEYTDQIYSTTNPTIEGVTSWRHEGLEGFTETATKAGSDEIKYVLKKDTLWYWWNGSAWALSAGTYAQANTAAEIVAHMATFTTDAVVSKFKAFLHSATGVTTPALDTLVVDYDFSGETIDTIETCVVWGYIKYQDGTPIPNLTITALLEKDFVKYKTNLMLYRQTYTATTDSIGYFEITLPETANASNARYLFTIDGKIYYAAVPNEETKHFWLLNGLTRVK